MARKYEMDMTTGALLPKIIRFSIPLMLSSLLQLLYNAADVVVAVGPGKAVGLDTRFPSHVLRPLGYTFHEHAGGTVVLQQLCLHLQVSA